MSCYNADKDTREYQSTEGNSHYLDSLDIGDNQSQWSVHGHTHIMVGPVGDGGAVWVHGAVEYWMVDEG